MVELVKPAAEWAAAVLEAIGLVIILLLGAFALLYAAVRLVKGAGGAVVFRETRHRLAQGILLGLEFLVGADIVHTVAVDLTFASVGVLAIVVAVRTFLSFTLEVELTGRWPWQREKGPGTASEGA